MLLKTQFGSGRQDFSDSVNDLMKRATNLGQQVENMKSEVSKLNRLQAGINNTSLLKCVKYEPAM